MKVCGGAAVPLAGAGSVLLPQQTGAEDLGSKREAERREEVGNI